MNLKKILIAFLIFFVPTMSFAETWHTIQGSGGSWRGTWTKTSGKAPQLEHFDVKITDDQTVYTGTGDVWYISKSEESQSLHIITHTKEDDVYCYFVAFRKNNVIEGEQACAGTGVTYKFQAVIDPDSK